MTVLQNRGRMETSRDATILDEISRAFIPPCILLSKDCLSRTRHLLESRPEP